jgi:hypothetical protein
MVNKRPRPTDAEFEELKRVRDVAIAETVRAACERLGWDPVQASFHASHTDGCYCACPDGPCQHTWDGEPWEDEGAHSATCSRCGAVAMFHDMRCMP